MAEVNEDREELIIQDPNLVGAAGPTGPTGPAGPTGGGASTTPQVTHVGDERNGENLADLLDELLYVVLTGSDFDHGLGFQEKGSTVANLPLTWTKNKASIISQLITGTLIGTENAGPSANGYTLVGINITSDGQWTLTLNDGTTQVVLTTTLKFYNRIYWGARTNGTINDAFVLGLAGSLLRAPKTALQFTVTAGTNDRIWLATRSADGTPTFKINGFEGGFTLEATFSHQNASGFSENFDVWGSDTLNLGLTTVDVTWET